jgi:signal-transduction protein with cAMP-binding, CBS, and nucleotidyltransferase domain
MSFESPIKDYIDSNLNTVSNQTIIGEIGKKMVDLGVDSILVLENDEISGIVTQKDLMTAFSKKIDFSETVESIVSRPLITITNTANIGQALKMMKENDIRRLVVKEGSNPIGMITQKKIFGNLSSKAFEIPELEMPEKIKCPYCSSFFQEKDELSKHIDQIHVGYGVFQGNFSRAEDLGSISSPEHYPKTIS